MSAIKKLAGQTAIYGLPSILGRFLNYLLVPLHTGQFITSEYGIVSDVYAIVAFVAVMLTWGLETAYFRYANMDTYSPEKVLKTALSMVFFSGAIFLAVTLIFSQETATWLRYPDNPEFIKWMALALVFDAWSAIPMAWLRKTNRPIRFAVVNFASIATNIGLNVFFIGYCYAAFENNSLPSWAHTLFDPERGVEYVFLANAIASAVKFIMLLPTYGHFSITIDKTIARALLKYGSPLMLAGFAGIINETVDRRLIRLLLEADIGTQAALAQVGVYSACYKLSIIITLFIQAFRYAAEPFFFAKATESDGRQVYATVFHYFVIVVSLIFVVVVCYLDLFKRFIRTEAYWEGLHIVPILLLANICLGLYYNFSVWYKMSNKTQFGAYMALIGAAITLGLNVLLIPSLGYTGAAYTTLATYATMAVISYLLGQKHFRIPYRIRPALGYIGLSVILASISRIFEWEETGKSILVNSLLLFVFVVVVWKRESAAFLKWLKR